MPRVMQLLRGVRLTVRGRLQLRLDRSRIQGGWHRLWRSDRRQCLQVSTLLMRLNGVTLLRLVRGLPLLKLSNLSL